MTLKLIYTLAFVCLVTLLQAQSKNLTLYFLYGSKPAKCCKATEGKHFGGLHGGHVSIGIDNEVVGFGPSGKFHIFSQDKNRHAAFSSEKLSSFKADTADKKYTVITIPLTAEQYNKVKLIHNKYQDECPYDYAFFGMRCAAATYEILSQIDVVKKKGRVSTYMGIFYPKVLRKKMLKLAKEKGYKVRTQAGSKSRVWEKD